MAAKKTLMEILSSPTHASRLVFDLDSTLFDVSHRSASILKHFIEHSDALRQHPAAREKLKTVNVRSGDWGLREAVVRAGIAFPADVISAMKDYWRKHFFSNHFLHADQPYPGSLQFVQTLDQSGYEIMYLTGRDAPNMREGTIEILNQWGFPLRSDSHLVMKPQKGSLEDEDFKDRWFQENRAPDKQTWFFENEPLIIEKVRNSSPEIKIIWLKTTHSRRAKEPTDIVALENWLL